MVMLKTNKFHMKLSKINFKLFNFLAVNYHSVWSLHWMRMEMLKVPCIWTMVINYLVCNLFQFFLNFIVNIIFTKLSAYKLRFLKILSYAKMNVRKLERASFVYFLKTLAWTSLRNLRLFWTIHLTGKSTCWKIHD